MRTSLKEYSPHLVDEWSEENYPLTPEKITYGSNKKVLWKGKCGHKWSASIKNRVNGDGCPYCSNNAVLKGFNDLESLYPKVAKEWSKKNFPLKASMVTPFSNRKVWWECEKGHEWFSLISSRTDGSGCPYCVGTVLKKNVNDFKTQYPDIALEWSVKNTSLLPDEISPKSRRNVWWTCKTCGYEWKAVVNARVKGGGCPVCSNRKVLVGYNDLATTDKHILSDWDYEKNNELLPTQLSRNSMREIWWKYTCGHSAKVKVYDKVVKNVPCPKCEDEYDLLFPKLAVIYYFRKSGCKVIFNEDKVIGLPLELYIPDERIAIEFSNEPDKIEKVKMFMCNKRDISLIKIQYEKDKKIELVDEIKKIIQKCRINYQSNSDEDITNIREMYMKQKL